jgi:hypothetical protein
LGIADLVYLFNSQRVVICHGAIRCAHLFDIPDISGTYWAWEGNLITLQRYEAKSTTTKFVPVLFDGQNERFIPEPLRGQTQYLLNTEARKMIALWGNVYHRRNDFLERIDRTPGRVPVAGAKLGPERDEPTKAKSGR